MNTAAAAQELFAKTVPVTKISFSGPLGSDETRAKAMSSEVHQAVRNIGVAYTLDCMKSGMVKADVLPVLLRDHFTSVTVKNVWRSSELDYDQVLNKVEAGIWKRDAVTGLVLAIDNGYGEHGEDSYG
jgi:hypothetical protein